MIDSDSFHTIQINIASPERIRECSYGEVKKSEDIDYKTKKFETDGLFCEKIFGPTKDFECSCGKYKLEQSEDISKLENKWYLESGIPSYILGLSKKKLEIMETSEIKKSLTLVDFDDVLNKLREKVRRSHGQKQTQALKRLHLVESFRKSGNIVCEKCGVTISNSNVRSERMGHIELAKPMCHIWYLKSGILSDILGLSKRSLEKIIYCDSYIVIDPKETDLAFKQLLTLTQLCQLRKQYSEDSFEVMTGAEAIKTLLSITDLHNLSKEIREKINKTDKDNQVYKKRLIKRLNTIETFIKSGNNPTWMILDVLPVIPPKLRSMILTNGVFTTSDLNELYKTIIDSNNKLKSFLNNGNTDIFVNHHTKTVQKAVDTLIANGRTDKSDNRKHFKSLSNRIKGELGIFRENILLKRGKRVDYSGISVLSPNPNLKINQCGLPKEMALELFKPFVIKKLIEKGYVFNIPSAATLIKEVQEYRGCGYIGYCFKSQQLRYISIWDVLQDVIKKESVILCKKTPYNRLSIQSFEIILTDGKTIQINPLIIKNFKNFDDEISVHIPLSPAVKYESKLLLNANRNILNPASGNLALEIEKDIIQGLYYLTSVKEKGRGEGKIFSSETEALLAYEAQEIELQSKIRLFTSTGQETTVGRIIFNQAIPKELQISSINDAINLERLEKIIIDCYRVLGASKTATIIDKLKTLSFNNLTKAGISYSINDFCNNMSVYDYFNSISKIRKNQYALDKKNYLLHNLIKYSIDTIIREDDNCGYVYIEPLKQISLGQRILGRIAAEDIINHETGDIIVKANSQIDKEASSIIDSININKVAVYSPLTCKSSKGICKKCYGINLSNLSLPDIGEPVGIIASQSIADVDNHEVIEKAINIFKAFDDNSTIKDDVSAMIHVLNQLQRLYSDYGFTVNDKHFEVILKSIIDNDDKSSFLLNASMHNPIDILTEAAITGQTDTMDGIQENVMLGKLMNGGTGTF